MSKKTHGMSKTKFYVAWRGMKHRTTSEKYHASHRYKGRGITVCERWQKFENFYEDMYDLFLEHIDKYGEEGTSIDRIDNNSGYCEENCRWATRMDQCSNQEKCVIVKYRGVKLTLNQFARIVQIDRKTLSYRMFKMGLTPEEAASPGKKSSNENANKARWTKSGLRKFEHNGEMKTAKELAELSGVKLSTIKSRLFMYGWTAEKAVQPVE